MDKPWETILEEAPIQLMSVSIFEGHPKQYATLVPDKEIRKDKKIVNIWQLISSAKEIYWRGCSYDRTSVMLLRPIDANFRTCQITYDPSVSVGSHPSVVEINCY